MVPVAGGNGHRHSVPDTNAGRRGSGVQSSGGGTKKGKYGSMSTRPPPFSHTPIQPPHGYDHPPNMVYHQLPPSGPHPRYYAPALPGSFPTVIPGAALPPIPPPDFGHLPQDQERNSFMLHFSRFYDALLDSTQLRNDLATKIHKANELVAAHQIELRKVENLRAQYETALTDFRDNSRKLMREIAGESLGMRQASGLGRDRRDVDMS